MSDIDHWIALNFVPDIGPVLAGRLLAEFGSPEKIFRASVDDLKRVEDVGVKRAVKIKGYYRWDMVNREMALAEKLGVHLIPQNSAAYPEPLRRIYGAPLVLYVKGTLRESDRYAIAMVGSRISSEYGIMNAESISGRLASSGVTVVSGMARGIDSASHKAALKAGGRTIAVLGSGLDVCYPPENRELARGISSSGAVVSEFPFGTLPNKENFPRRNRVISGLSLGVVVIEATLDSGSLITVGYALEQGKEIFAVPGNVTSDTSKGTNDLIRKGAKLIESADDVLEELGLQIKGILKEERTVLENDLEAMTDDERTFFSALSSEPKHIDSISREINVPVHKALSVLLGLELKGIVRQSHGKYFSRN